MTDKQYRSPTGGDLAHLAQTAVLKGGVAHGQHLINNQNLRLEMGSGRAGNSQIKGPTNVTRAGVEDWLRRMELLRERCTAETNCV